jgi:asparagine synthase (glutamine-hydrolysing)
MRILLDGIDGDTAVYHGDGYLAELARAGRWETFVAEARAIAQHENLPSVPFLFEQYAWPYLAELARGWRWPAFAGEVQALSRHIGISRRKVWLHWGFEPAVAQPIRRTWRMLRGRQANGSGGRRSITRPEFAARIDLDGRMAALAGDHRPPRTAREEHYALLTSSLIPYIFELSDKAAMAFSLEGRHPFADRRLVEFCLALPPEQKLQRGWIRIILRRAMAGMLREEIRWRGGKTVNSAAVTAALLSGAGGLLEEVILHKPGALEALVDMDSLRETYGRYVAHKDRTDEMLVWQAVTLSLWLRHTNLSV